MSEDAQSRIVMQNKPLKLLTQSTKDDLTTDLYDEPGLIAALKTGFTPAGDALGHEMAEVIKDSTSLWTDADRHAIAAYLLGLEQ